MHAYLAAAVSAGDTGSVRLGPDRPWDSAGLPCVRVDTGSSRIYPYVLYVGDHDPVPVPMTAASLRALRDSLSALLAAPEPAKPDDFVDEWASVHGAAVRDGCPAEPVIAADDVAVALLQPARRGNFRTAA